MEQSLTREVLYKLIWSEPVGDRCRTPSSARDGWRAHIGQHHEREDDRHRNRLPADVALHRLLIDRELAGGRARVGAGAKHQLAQDPRGSRPAVSESWSQ
jgi:hypothetical protein